jgi:spore coat polysaccharide biosynthesis predicted glycosyltransferase SpsG
MRRSTESRLSKASIGIVVDAGPAVGFGSAIRCTRLGRALQVDGEVIYYPLSDACERFLQQETPDSEIRAPKSEIDCPVVITDIREPRPIKADKLISIHDLGLGQRQSDVVIDGSITQVFTYPAKKGRKYFIGPQYMITRNPLIRGDLRPTVLVNLDGGTSAARAKTIVDRLDLLGLHVVSTMGLKEPDLNHAISTCAFAVSTAGPSLYDLLASGVPTIAVAVNRLQLRTALAFQEHGAVICAGMAENLSAETFLGHCAQILKDPSFVDDLGARAQKLVDGKGLLRVVEIVRKVQRPVRAISSESTRRKQVWLNEATATYTNC